MLRNLFAFRASRAKKPVSMIRRTISRKTLACFAAGAAALSLLHSPGEAFAQAPPLSDSIVIGAWSFRPSAELRVRGEYRRNPLDSVGSGLPLHWDPASSESTGLVGGALQQNIDNAWAISERTRLGLEVERAQVTAKLLLQDSRVLGDMPATQVLPAQSSLGGLGGLGSLSGLSLFEAYIDVHSLSGRSMFLRVGRQRVTWGDGRLIGESDWTMAPRSLDAARFYVELGDFDLELLAALLAPPGTYVEPAASATSGSPVKRGTGAQLYGLDLKWHGMPLLNAELSALARVSRTFSSAELLGVRTPALTPGDTVTLDGRVFGDYRGFRYAAEGAYQLGRVASYGVNRDISALALSLRASLETALPWHLTMGAHAAYASGDDGTIDASSTQKRFDPILADAYENLGPMGFYAWSNVLEAGGFVNVKPADWLRAQAGYRYASLANAKGRWTASSLVSLGSDSTVDASTLGHELDVAFTLDPWDVVQFKAGYGLFLYGDKAKAILKDTPAAADMQHWVFIQTLVHVP